jgi:hypothetical protein
MKAHIAYRDGVEDGKHCAKLHFDPRTMFPSYLGAWKQSFLARELTLTNDYHYYLGFKTGLESYRLALSFSRG